MSKRRVKKVTGPAARIVLSKNAPWASDKHNRKLRSTYRDRFVQVGDRYFKIVAEDLTNLWRADEITVDGEDLGHIGGTLQEPMWVFDGWEGKWCFGLAEARLAIAEACGIEGALIR